MSALKAVALSTAALLATGCVGYVLSLTERMSHSQTAMQHRIDLLEQDVGRLEQRVVRVEDVLAEVPAARTAFSAKGAEAELPVSASVLPAITAPVRPVKHKPVARRPASQGSEYPQMAKPYPWEEWEQP